MTETTNNRLHVYVSGRVQGVFFRESTRQNAESLNLAGWVKNLPDGRVEAVFEGNGASLEKMLDWCQDGPDFAVVEAIESSYEEATGEFSGFEVV